MLYCITSDANCEWLVEEMSVLFLHCKVTAFTFAVNMYLRRATLRQCKHAVFIIHLPMILAFINDPCL